MSEGDEQNPGAAASGQANVPRFMQATATAKLREHEEKHAYKDVKESAAAKAKRAGKEERVAE